ncbi:hypothetical protein [Actinoplanes sp. NPDC049118]|uniref:hypothetical protein n=1 Tax=Actinoplanes sp. NPDC049118 TaxID=3155769 RepID=UPI0033CFE9AE
MHLLLLTIAPVVSGVALGYLLGGRLAGFRTIRIRALWLVWLAAGVQFAQSADPCMRIRVLLTLTALATLIYSIGAPHEHGG